VELRSQLEHPLAGKIDNAQVGVTGPLHFAFESGCFRSDISCVKAVVMKKTAVRKMQARLSICGLTWKKPSRDKMRSDFSARSNLIFFERFARTSGRKSRIELVEVSDMPRKRT